MRRLRVGAGGRLGTSEVFLLAREQQQGMDENRDGPGGKGCGKVRRPSCLTLLPFDAVDVCV
jgi:hypothetical protein